VAAGLESVRIHDLRHTAVALWIAAGASLKEVAARAGHTSVRVVLDTYGGLTPEQDTGLRGRLDAVIDARRGGRRRPSGPNVVSRPVSLTGRRLLRSICAGRTWWARQGLNLWPLPCQQTREPLCSTVFSQVACDRRCGRETLS
jgi:hypothetical protein